MRCLYCGKQLALFRRLTGGGEFCSDAHKASYHQEFNRLALDRLKQAQEKSDELRAAAQNQMALIRRGAEPQPLNIRSNAHWIEPKPGREPKAVLAAREVRPEPAAPKACEFLNALPAPAPPPPFQLEVHQTQAIAVGSATMKPDWSPVLANTETAAAPRMAESIAPVATAAEPKEPAFAAIPAIHLTPLTQALENRTPEWKPPFASPHLHRAGHVGGGRSPLPREDQFRMEAPVPPAPVEARTPVASVPLVVPPPPVFPPYPSLPAVEIDPLRFVPEVKAELAMHSQFLPFRFDFVPSPAPDFDVLVREDPPWPQTESKTRPMLKRTEPEHILDLPAELLQPVRRKSAGSSKLLQMGMIGEIHELARPAAAVPPKLAKPLETGVQAQPFGPQPPSAAIPRTAALNFRGEESAEAPAVLEGPENERPSTLKLKLAAMAPATPETAPAAEPAGTRVAPPGTPERSFAMPEPARIRPTPRRRTVPIPSILEPMEPAEEHRSLWGALRKYLGK